MKELQNRIKKIKKELSQLGDMRPGSLTQQTYKRKDYERPYWQVSYTHNHQSKTEYVKDDLVEQIKAEIVEYKRFKELTAEWVDLAIKISKEKISMKK